MFVRFLVLIVFALCTNILSAGAKECKLMGEMEAWKHDGGSFIHDEKSGTWHELNSDGESVASFVEFTRKDDTVVLRDESRHLFLLLRPDLAAIMNNGDDNFQPLFQGRFVSSVSCAWGKAKEVMW